MSRWLPRIDTSAGIPIPPPGGDHFAPTIIVGNVPAGDPVAAIPAPFQYIGDPGDGSGIALAFAALIALGAGGWIHIRRGLYDFGLVGSPALPLAIAGFRVTGDGCATILRMSTLDRRLFVMTTGGPAGINGAPPELMHIGIDWTVAAAGAIGTEMIDLFGGAVISRRATIWNVEIVKNLGGAAITPILNPDESLTSLFRTGFSTSILDCRVINCDGTAGLTVVAFRASGFGTRISQCIVSGTNVSYRAESGGTLLLGNNGGGGAIFASHNGIISAAGSARARIEGNTVSGDEGIVLLSGGGSIVDGNDIAFTVGDGIRVEAGALDAIVTSNRMNGFPLVVTEPTAEAAHNVL